MSSPAPRRSADNTVSPLSSPPANQHSFPQSDASPRQGSRAWYDPRRASVASSITSIGGILESASQGRGDSIAELGNNGWFKVNTPVREEVYPDFGNLAISTLLQPPIIRTGLLPQTSGVAAQRPPSTRDIPPVTLTNIPHVDVSVFQPYLAQAGTLYAAFRRARNGDEEKGSGTLRRSSRGGSASIEPFVHGIQRRQLVAPTSPKTELPDSIFNSPLEAPQPKRRTSGGISRRAGLAVAPLSTIPNVYFEDEFRPENPRTFDVISERSEIARPPGVNGSIAAPGTSGKKSLATNAILQEKLSWYMDIVEIHLISSISSASTSFFAALGSLRELHSEATQSVAKIKALRENLETLDKDMVSGGLKVVAMRRQRENTRKLSNAIQQLHHVIELMARCEEQINQGDIENALKDLTKVESLVEGQPRPFESNRDEKHMLSSEHLIDLRGIKALEGISGDITSLRRRIGKTFEARFIETLLGDIRSHVDSVPLSATFQRWDKASNRSRGNHSRAPSQSPAYLQVDSALRNTLLAQLKGLARSDSVMSATVAYREVILREFKNLIRRHVPSSTDDDAESTMSVSTQEGRHTTQQEKSSILARNLRALDVEDAEDMLKKIYSNIGEALRRLGTQVKVLLDITSSLGNPQGSGPLKSPSLRSPSLKSPPKSPQYLALDSYFKGEPSPAPLPSAIKHEEVQQALDLSSLLGQAVDIAQAQITKILRVRSEQSTRLPLSWFLRYFTLNRLFADECEAVSGRGGNAFKTVVNAHIKEFVGHFGDTERQRLVQSTDTDSWDAQDFSDSDTKRLARILEASTQEVEAWNKGDLIWENVNHTNEQLQSNGTAVNGISGAKEKARTATIDEQKYILPESALTVASGIENFECLLTGIPSMAPEISGLLSDYLRLFNSRSSQLILGAGATRSGAGLKNITTKHLALSSQSLSFVIALIPHIREFVRRHSSSSGNLMTEFDKVKRLYQDHQSGIHDKIIEILSGRASTHVNNMKKINWDNSSEKVNDYMVTLIKETTLLHKVLSKHLPETTVQMIMVPIMDSYREQWGKAIREVEIKTPDGKNRCYKIPSDHDYRPVSSANRYPGSSVTSNSSKSASAKSMGLVI